MAALISAVARRSLPLLASVVPKDHGIRDWMTKGSFSVDDSLGADSVVLKNISMPEFVQYQAYDFQRFALASFETLAFCKAESSRPRALGWPLLKIYYAAFFGAHALMRANGESVTRIESSLAKAITTLGQAYCGAAFGFSSGTYHLKLKQNSDRSIDLIVRSTPDTGGAHDAFWRVFHSYTQSLSAELAGVGDADANTAIARISDLQDVLTEGGASAGAWLSGMRNRINYQHLLGVWFPFGASQADVDYVAEADFKTLGSSRLDINHRKQALQAFAAASLFLARLSYDVAEAIVRDSAASKANCFAQKWGRLKLEIGAKF